jgi:hypothetical protein
MKVDSVDVSSFNRSQIEQLFSGKNVIRLDLFPAASPQSSSTVGNFFQSGGGASQFATAFAAVSSSASSLSLASASNLTQVDASRSLQPPRSLQEFREAIQRTTDMINRLDVRFLLSRDAIVVCCLFHTLLFQLESSSKPVTSSELMSLQQSRSVLQLGTRFARQYSHHSPHTFLRCRNVQSPA